MNKTRYVIQHPSGEILGNILEITELWAWAVLYRRQGKGRENVSASMVPPDWIQGLRDVGYRAMQIVINTEAHVP
jgi:hypothetical protein